MFKLLSMSEISLLKSVLSNSNNSIFLLTITPGSSATSKIFDVFPRVRLNELRDKLRERLFIGYLFISYITPEIEINS